MKVMRVVLIQLIYQPHYKRLLAFTMFPAWNMPHSTQWPPHLAVHHKLLLDQCADTYPLAQLTTTLQTALQYAQTAQMKRKKIFRQYPWMMNTGLLKKHLKEPFVCQCLCPYGNLNTNSYIDSLDLSDILDYEDYMVTSSDEEIPGMEEVSY